MGENRILSEAQEAYDNNDMQTLKKLEKEVEGVVQALTADANDESIKELALYHRLLEIVRDTKTRLSWALRNWEK